MRTPEKQHTKTSVLYCDEELAPDLRGESQAQTPVLYCTEELAPDLRGESQAQTPVLYCTEELAPDLRGESQAQTSVLYCDEELAFNLHGDVINPSTLNTETGKENSPNKQPVQQQKSIKIGKPEERQMSSRTLYGHTTILLNSVLKDKKYRVSQEYKPFMQGETARKIAEKVIKCHFNYPKPTTNLRMSVVEFNALKDLVSEVIKNYIAVNPSVSVPAEVQHQHAPKAERRSQRRKEQRPAPYNQGGWRTKIDNEKLTQQATPLQVTSLDILAVAAEKHASEAKMLPKFGIMLPPLPAHVSRPDSWQEAINSSTQPHNNGIV